MIRTNLCKTIVCKQQGMTLIELILVVAIIGILASIVYPSYSDHVRKAHRKQAIVDMAKIQLHLEKHYDNGYLVSTLFPSGKCEQFCDVESERYEITIAENGHGYLITAVPKSTKGQDKDQCSGEVYEQLTLSHTGESLPANCWL